jgi:hypothetical protein
MVFPRGRNSNAHGGGRAADPIGHRGRVAAIAVVAITLAGTVTSCALRCALR